MCDSDTRSSALAETELAPLGPRANTLLAVVSFPNPALDCTTLPRWLERAELYYLTVASTPFSLCRAQLYAKVAVPPSVACSRPHLTSILRTRI
jgi:hypothetical protein